MTTSNAPGRVDAPGRRRPRWVTTVVAVFVLLGTAIALTVLGGGGRGNTDALDPADPGFTGAQALARVLVGHGVTVTVVRSQQELLARRVAAPPPGVDVAAVDGLEPTAQAGPSRTRIDRMPATHP